MLVTSISDKRDPEICFHIFLGSIELDSLENDSPPNYLARVGVLCVWAQFFSHVWLFAMPWTVACQAALSMEFSRQEYWSGLHFFLQGIFQTQGSNPHHLHWQADSLPLSHVGKFQAVKKNIQLNKFQRSYWLYSVIHELGSILSSR